jgi:hypothetical protein
MRFLVGVLALVAALATALPAAADPPTVRHVQDVFVDINPCSGLQHVVTVDVTIYDHGVSSHGRATITTSSGFVGRGEETGVFDNGHFVLNHMLVNPETGQRIRAKLVVIGQPDGAPPEEAHVFRSRVECVGRS